MKKEIKYNSFELIVKFLHAEATESEIDKLKLWLASSQDNRRLFDIENELWQQVSTCENIGDGETESAWNTISSRTGIKKNYGSSVKVMRKINYRILFAAASLACLIALSSLILLISELSSLKKDTLLTTVISTGDGEKSTICLPDSSKITINSGSTVKFNGEYNKKHRTVILNGEAYFDVKTDPAKPFIVKAGEMKIEATGTSFNVLSYNDENRLETTLESGHIMVEITSKEPVKLNPGEQVVYSRNSENVEVRKVFTETYTSWKENMLRFNDTPFEETLRRIARRYNVRFEITNTDLYELKYTATFIDETIEEVMGMLKVVSPIDYRIYYLTSAKDNKYQKPRIIVGMKRSNLNKSR